MKLKNIYLEKVEGHHPIPQSGNYKTFEEAESTLHWWSKKSPENGAYDKTDFIVEFKDGFKYRGTIDLKNDGTSYHLMTHILDFLYFYSGRRKPVWLDNKKYRESLVNIDMTIHGMILDKYFKRYKEGL